MKKSKRRSIAASRAASLKGWRIRKAMRHTRDIKAFLAKLRERTIDRLPKVEWK